MRVLLIHNSYQDRGGEDVVFEAEASLLKSRGHVVVSYHRSNHELNAYNALSLAKEAIWSDKSYKEIVLLISSFRPDIVHVHNTFPLISPSVYLAVKKTGTPLVQTLHNYRLVCLNAMLLRDDKVCMDCVGKVPWRGVAYKCYRGSSSASAAVATIQILHKAFGTFERNIDKYIVLSDFCRDLFSKAGLPLNKIAVKPNFSSVKAIPGSAGRYGFLFAGRFSREKGIGVFMEVASRLPDISFMAAGGAAIACGLNNLTFLGSLDRAELHEVMSQSVALVVPSVWLEPFGLVVIEAFALGVPVIASRTGSLAGLVDDGLTGLLFDPSDPDDLAAKIIWAEENSSRMRVMGINAQAVYREKYSPEVNYEMLLKIYQDAILAV